MAKASEHLKSAIIGYWRMGVDETVISYLTGVDYDEVVYVIRGYKIKLK